MAPKKKATKEEKEELDEKAKALKKEFESIMDFDFSYINDFEISKEIIKKFTSDPITKEAIAKSQFEAMQNRLEFITLLKLHDKYCSGELKLHNTSFLIEFFDKIRVSEIIEYFSDEKNNITDVVRSSKYNSKAITD